MNPIREQLTLFAVEKGR